MRARGAAATCAFETGVRACYFFPRPRVLWKKKGRALARKEKFGKFVLLDEVDSSGLGTEYRAAKLSATGLEKIVSVLRLKPALSANPEGVKALMDQVKVAAQLQNPNVLKIYGIGKVETSYYISYEFLEGKSLRGIFSRCRQEGFPFSIDHAEQILLAISKAWSMENGKPSWRQRAKMPRRLFPSRNS